MGTEAHEFVWNRGGLGEAHGMEFGGIQLHSSIVTVPVMLAKHRMGSLFDGINLVWS